MVTPTWRWPSSRSSSRSESEKPSTAPLARGVARGHRQRDNGGGAGDVHDVPGRTSNEIGEKSMRHRENPRQIHGNSRKMAIERHVEKPTAEYDARVVYENIDRSEFGVHARHGVAST